MKLMPGETLLRSCNPNRNGFVYLTRYDFDVDGSTAYLVYDAEHDEFDTEPVEYATLDEATAAYEAEAHRVWQIPNWEAQAEYDERWGDPLPHYGDY